MASSQLEALIFDVDGTLADTERDGHRIAFNQAFEQFNLNWYWDEETYGRLLRVTGGKERMRHYLETESNSDEAALILDRHLYDIHHAKNGYYKALLNRGEISMRPGVGRLLREARSRGLRLAIATTTTPENVEALLQSQLGADAEHWFAAVVAGDMVAHKKPAPDVYLEALKRLGLEAGSCLAFEDSGMGLSSSLDAGISTIITVNGYTQNHDFSGAITVLNHLGEPGDPATHLAGETVKGYVDVDTLLALHASVQE